MKNLLRISGIFLIATSIWTGCTKDSAAAIRDAFVATFNVTESWTENSRTLTKPAFTMSVEKSTQNVEKLLLNNFSNSGAGFTLKALVNGDSIIIPLQTLPNLKEISGSGILTDTTLTFFYTECFNTISFPITAIAKKEIG